MADKRGDFSRRDFLKVATLAAAGAGLAACGREFEANKVEFAEVKAGDVVFLKTPGNDKPEYITIDYRVTNKDLEGHLFSRVVNGNVTILPFKEGATTKRMVGEINGDEIVKLKKSDELSSEITVGIYPNAGLARNTDDRKDFPENADIFGIKISVAPIDLMLDGRDNPLEINGNVRKYDVGPENYENQLEYFGEGWATGLYSSETKSFIVTGYVCDSRALVEDK